VPTIAGVSKKILAAKEGTEGVLVSDTPSTDIGSVAGWFIEAGMAGDFEKASAAFKKAAGIVDRLVGAEPTPLVRRRARPSHGPPLQARRISWRLSRWQLSVIKHLIDLGVADFSNCFTVSRSACA
jgi:hypothetical protein